MFGTLFLKMGPLVVITVHTTIMVYNEMSGPQYRENRNVLVTEVGYGGAGEEGDGGEVGQGTTLTDLNQVGHGWMSHLR